MDTRVTSGRDLLNQLRAGTLSRRRFALAASALGLPPALIAAAAQRVAAQDATPSDAEYFVSDGTPNESGMEGRTRGEGGELRIIQYQAPTILSPHTATGYKDFDAAQLVIEPLFTYLPDGQLYGVLIEEVPTLENGLLAEDGTTVTLKLKEGMLWSDGEPVTANDIAFTVDWVKDPANATTTKGTYAVIESVEVQDDLTALVTFTQPNPFWFEPFTSYTTGMLYPKHILEVEGAHDAFVMKPVGTGPYKVESFTPNDEIQFVINENYREENKPFFERVLLKGGGDGAAAARAVLQTGEFDFAWGPGVEPDILDSMMGPDTLGALVPTLPVNVERMAINHSDPWTEVDGQTSEMNTPHPVLSDPAVRKAMSLAIDRQLIADQFYGLGSTAAVNVINGDPAVESPNIEYVFDAAQAEQVLEEAGWVKDGDVRSRDGNELSLVFASPVSGRRQKTQAVIKANLEAIGFKIQLEQVDSGIFFDASEGNEQSFNKFPWDLMLYVMPQGSTRPLTYMEQWYSGPERENVSQKSNAWTGSNIVRWVNEEYDELWRKAQGETNPDALIETFIAMNDLVMENHVIVPVVVIGGGSIGANTLRMETLVTGSFSGAYANIANWNTLE